jgi:hypothetical protein
MVNIFRCCIDTLIIIIKSQLYFQTSLKLHIVQNIFIINSNLIIYMCSINILVLMFKDDLNF